MSNSRISNDNPIIKGNEVYNNKHSGIQLNGDCHMGGDGFENYTDPVTPDPAEFAPSSPDLVQAPNW